MAGQFIDLADLLAENLKAQETEPQTYLDGKLLVTSSKKRVQEITDTVTWVEAFTMYSWNFCSAHPSRWQDMMQYKLLILKTSHQFPGKARLHYDIAFRKDAATSGVVDWSRMNLDLYNFHTRRSLPQTRLSSNFPSPATKLSANSSNFCRSWNDGTCRWPFGQCRYRHCCEKCEGDHPRVNCPFLASKSYRATEQTPAALTQWLVHPKLLVKFDVESAYHNVPVHSNDRYLLGMKWRGEYLIDMAPPFGSHLAPYIFSSIVDLLEWILKHNFGLEFLLH